MNMIRSLNDFQMYSFINAPANINNIMYAYYVYSCLKDLKVKTRSIYILCIIR